MKLNIAPLKNFARIYQLPLEKEYPEGFCWGGGLDVTMKMIDFFNPVPSVSSMPEVKDWTIEDLKSKLIGFLTKKKYLDKSRRYLFVSEFGMCFMFNSEGLIND